MCGHCGRRVRESDRSTISRPPTSRHGIGAERDLDGAAHGLAGAQVETAVGLGALDAAVDQQPAGEMGLGVRAHAIDQHVAVVERSAQDERRGADVDPSRSWPGTQLIDRTQVGDPRPVPWSATCPVCRIDPPRWRAGPSGIRAPGNLPHRGPPRWWRRADRRSLDRRRATDVFSRGGDGEAPRRCSAGEGVVRHESGRGGARGGSSC